MKRDANAHRRADCHSRCGEEAKSRTDADCAGIQQPGCRDGDRHEQKKTRASDATYKREDDYGYGNARQVYDGGVPKLTPSENDQRNQAGDDLDNGQGSGNCRLSREREDEQRGRHGAPHEHSDHERVQDFRRWIFGQRAAQSQKPQLMRKITRDCPQLLCQATRSLEVSLSVALARSPNGEVAVTR